MNIVRSCATIFYIKSTFDREGLSFKMPVIVDKSEFLSKGTETLSENISPRCKHHVRYRQPLYKSVNFEQKLNSNKNVLMIQFLLLLSIGGYCSDFTEDTTITPIGWNMPRQVDREHAIVYSFEGDYGFTRYWEVMSCGGFAPEYTIIRTKDSLSAYWQKIKGKCNDLEMPQVDFKKNILLIVKPGTGNTHFKYKVSSTMKNRDINFAATQFLAGSLVRATNGYYPLLAFELPTPGSAQKINVKINVDSRVFGSFPK